MKHFLLFLFIFAFSEVQSSETDSLLIRYSDWDIEPTHISTCSNFERLNGYQKEYVVFSRCHVDSLKLLLANLQEKDDEYFPVRCKLYIFDSDTIKEKICINKSNIMLNGKNYANNDTIIRYINYLMNIYPQCDTERFLPDYLGDEYITGKDSLYNLLKNRINDIAYHINYYGEFVMNIKCNADKKGRTIGTAVRIVKPQNASKAEKRIARQIRKFIIHHISWKEDVDRSIFDDISFSIKYRR
jgi:hypothetical protein